MTDEKKVYGIDETCSALRLKPPVLRKYSALLEDAGYSEIQRNSSNARYYTDENLKVLRELIDYRNSGHMTLTDAAKSIATRENGVDIMSVMPAHDVANATKDDAKKIQNALLSMSEYIETTEQRHAADMQTILAELKAVRAELSEVKKDQAEQIALIEAVSLEEEVKVPESRRGIFSKLFKLNK